jgi:hypothetical protein
MTAAIQEDIGHACIWLCGDENTDDLGRYTAHLIVGKMDLDRGLEGFSKPHLLCSKSPEKVNSQ